MNLFQVFAAAILIFSTPLLASERIVFTLTPIQAEQIGQRIWENEGKGRIDRLTWWNEGEEFASMGINHFIWYPKDKQGPFEETFPSLIGYLQKQGVVVPPWLNNHPPCPWATRKDFMSDFEVPKMVELRQFLLRTKAWQVQFMAERLQNLLPKILTTEHLKKQFLRVLSTKKGSYALLDYYNFKGDGTSASERYKNCGWGVLQVLEAMEDNDFSGDFEFVRAACKVLERRVENAPPERGESRWLKGWLSRVKSYK